jgi:hypothetical protein
MRQRITEKRNDFQASDISIPPFEPEMNFNLIQKRSKKIHEQDCKPDSFGKCRIKNPNHNGKGSDANPKNPSGTLQMRG